MRHLGALVAVAIAVAACTSTTEPSTTTALSTTTTSTLASTTTTTTPTTTTTEPVPEVYGGVAVVGLAANPPTLNPLLSNDPEVLLIAQAWTVGVYEVSGDSGEFIPDVVTQLPTVSNGGVVENPDGTVTVTYDIVDEAVWADGTAISGGDFQFTLDTILDPSLSIAKEVYSNILSSTVGDKTFSYTLAFPTIAFESLFDIVLPAHDIAGSDFSTDWNDRAWLSAGPFTLDRWVPDTSLTFTRNANYWKLDSDGLALPYLDGVTFQIILDPTERFEAIAAGALHVIAGSAAASEDAQYSVLESVGASVATSAGPVWVHLNFQFGPGRWDRNPDSLNEYLTFRQAIMHAIDRQRIAQDLFGARAVPLDSYVTPYNQDLSWDTWSRYPYDPERATELIDDAIAAALAANPEATPDAVVFFTTNASNEERILVATLIGEMLTDIGIAYVDTSEDSITFFGETVGSGRYDIGMWAWQAAPGFAPLTRFHDVLDPGDSRSLTNFYRWGTEDSSVKDEFTRQMSSLLTTMRDSVDHDQMSLLIQQAEQIAASQALFLPLYAEPVSTVYWPATIEGFVMNATAAFTWNIEHWKMADAG